jgi:hypothetical protein
MAEANATYEPDSGGACDPDDTASDIAAFENYIHRMRLRDLIPDLVDEAIETVRLAAFERGSVSGGGSGTGERNSIRRYITSPVKQAMCGSFVNLVVQACLVRLLAGQDVTTLLDQEHFAKSTYNYALKGSQCTDRLLTCITRTIVHTVALGKPVIWMNEPVKGASRLSRDAWALAGVDASPNAWLLDIEATRNDLTTLTSVLGSIHRPLALRPVDALHVARMFMRPTYTQFITTVLPGAILGPMALEELGGMFSACGVGIVGAAQYFLAASAGNPATPPDFDTLIARHDPGPGRRSVADTKARIERNLGRHEDVPALRAGVDAMWNERPVDIRALTLYYTLYPQARYVYDDVVRDKPTLVDNFTDISYELWALYRFAITVGLDVSVGRELEDIITILLAKYRPSAYTPALRPTRPARPATIQMA